MWLLFIGWTGNQWIFIQWFFIRWMFTWWIVIRWIIFQWFFIQWIFVTFLKWKNFSLKTFFLIDAHVRATKNIKNFIFCFLRKKKKKTRKNNFIVLKKNYKALSEGQSAVTVIETINWESLPTKYATKQVLRSTILSSTIHFDLVRLISDSVRLSISRSKN